MKKMRLVLLLMVTALPVISYGQQTPKFIYCQIVGTEKMLSTKVTIAVDFGQKMKIFADNRMKDETGKPLVFNSMIDALNYMGKQGWEFSQAYTITISNQNVYHFLMKKPFDDLDDDAKTEFNKN